MASDLTYDPTPIFDLIPSFYRDSYKDKDKLEAIYRGWLRIIDTDAAALFSLDAQKDLSTLRPTTYQPLVYRELPHWESTGANHGHFKSLLPWPAAASGRFELFLQGVALAPEHQLFLDTIAIPTYVYSLTLEERIINGALVGGSLISFNEDILNKFLTGEFIGDAYGQGVSAPLFPTGSTPAGSFTTCLIHASGYSEIFYVGGDGQLDSLELEDVFDTFSAKVSINRRDITPTCSLRGGIVSLGFKYPIGTKVRIKITNTTTPIDQIYLLTNSTGSVNIGTVDPTANIETVELFVNFDLGGLNVAEGVIQASSTFTPGVSLRVSGTSTEAVQLSEAASRITTAVRDVTAVQYAGVELYKYAVGRAPSYSTSTDTRSTKVAIRFGRPVAPGTTLRVIAPVFYAHSHSAVVVDVVETLTSIKLRTAASLDAYPELVFLDEVLQIPGADYTVTGNTLTFTAPIVPGRRLEIYVVSNIPSPHKHAVTANSVRYETAHMSLSAAQTSPDQVPVFANGALVSRIRYVSTDTGILFGSSRTQGVPFIAHSTQRSLPFRHELTAVREPDYGYVGRIVSATTLQNGVEKPTVVLSGNKFSIQSDPYIVEAVEPVHRAFFCEAEVDEHLLQDIWGHVVGLEGLSTQTYANQLAAIALALRAASTPKMLCDVGSILLGSSFTSTPSILQSVAEDTVTLKDILTDVSYTLPRNPCAPVGLSYTSVNNRLTPVSKLIDVVDLNFDTPWMALLAEELSPTFKASDRLDTHELKVLTSAPVTYRDGILTDYSVNFHDEGVRAGDLIRIDIAARINDTLLGTDVIESRYLRIQAVTGSNSIRITYVPDVINTAYGEGPYGQGPYGGQSLELSAIACYTVWCRNRGRLDIGRRLDLTDVRALKARVASVISAHSALVRITWSAMREGANLDALKLFLAKMRPADAKIFVFTEAFSDACSTPLRSTSVASLGDEEPEPAFIANTMAVSESFVGLDTIVPSTPDTALLRNDGAIDISIVGIAEKPEPDVVDGDHYIVSNPPSVGSFWENVYSEVRGLEHMLVEATDVLGSLHYLNTTGVLGPVTGIEMAPNDLIVVDDDSGSNLITASSPFDYAAGSDLSLSFWVFPDMTGLTVGQQSVLFTWNRFALTLELAAGDLVQFKWYTWDPLTPVASPAVFIRNYIHVVVQYYLDGGQYTSKMFLNGVQVATASSGTVPAGLMIGIDSTFRPMQIGAGYSTVINPGYAGVLAQVGLAERAWTPAEVTTLYGAGKGHFPTLGADDVGQPLTDPLFDLYYQFHSYMPAPVIPDYSGKARNGAYFGTLTRKATTLESLMPPTDYTVSIEEYYLDGAGNIVTVPRAVARRKSTVYSGTANLLEPGGGIVQNNLLTVTRDGVSVTLPEIGAIRQADGTWTVSGLNRVCPSATIDTDDTELFTGFPV